MICSKPTSLASIGIGLAFMMALATNAYADSYPQISFNTGRDTSIQIISKTLVAPKGVGNTCTEKAALNFYQPSSDVTVASPGVIELDAECYHPSEDIRWGANIDVNILYQGNVIGSCTIGAYWNDTKEQGPGPINFTDSTNTWGVFQPTQCTNGYQINTDVASGEYGAMGVNIILSSEFNVWDGAGFGLYACTYHQGDRNHYCSTTFASLWGTITVDGSMQPAGGLKMGDTVCLAEDTGFEQYSNYYFTLGEDADGFQIDGYPLEAYGTVWNPDYYIYPAYQGLISPKSRNGSPSEVSRTPCVELPGDIIWVD